MIKKERIDLANEFPKALACARIYPRPQVPLRRGASGRGTDLLKCTPERAFELRRHGHKGLLCKGCVLREEPAEVTCLRFGEHRDPRIFVATTLHTRETYVFAVSGVIVEGAVQLTQSRDDIEAIMDHRVRPW
jgi:hypothetical protein